MAKQKTPDVGAIVHFRNRPDAQPNAAIVCAVDDTDDGPAKLNLCVISAGGATFPALAVPFGAEDNRAGYWDELPTD